MQCKGFVLVLLVCLGFCYSLSLFYLLVNSFFFFFFCGWEEVASLKSFSIPNSIKICCSLVPRKAVGFIKVLILCIYSDKGLQMQKNPMQISLLKYKNLILKRKISIHRLFYWSLSIHWKILLHFFKHMQHTSVIWIYEAVLFVHVF